MERRLVVGLGNPGEQYRETRHNAGFLVVEELARRWAATLDEELCHSLVGRAAGGRFLAQPQTFMNRSGHALKCLVEQLELPLESVLVVYDDVHLPLGRLRLRGEGGPGGHRGLESIVENLRSSALPRLRLGVGAQGEGADLVGSTPLATLPEDLAAFVLAPFPADQAAASRRLIERAADACDAWIDSGIAAAMNRFNGAAEADIGL